MAGSDHAAAGQPVKSFTADQRRLELDGRTKGTGAGALFAATEPPRQRLGLPLCFNPHARKVVSVHRKCRGERGHRMSEKFPPRQFR